MNFIFKLLWILCLAVAFMSIGVTVSRFYQTGRLFMFCAGFIALLYLASLMGNAIMILFFKGA